MVLAALGSKQEVKAQHNSELDEVFELYCCMGYTLKEAADEIGVKYSTLKTWAWEAGVSFEKDTRKTRYLPQSIEYEGQEYTVTDLAKMHNIKRETLKNRLANGWGIKEALSTPVIEGNWKQRLSKDKSTSGVDIGRLWLRGKL